MVQRNEEDVIQVESTGENDDLIPRVGFGTYKLNGRKCFNVVQDAIEVGYRHIDTAIAYENEAVIGRAISVSSVPRDEIFLTTKIKGYPEFLTYDRILKETNDCLRRLNTEYIDLLLIHWWNPHSSMEETFAALNQLVAAGKVKHIGVSNFSKNQLAEALDVSDRHVLTNQVEYHPYHSQAELVSFCQENDVILTAYSPLAEGLAATDDRLGSIGEKYDKSAAQVAIRWLIQQENVVTIPKTSSRERVSENYDVFDFKLTGEEMNQISELEGPFWYRQNREGGQIHKIRGVVGPVAELVLPGSIVAKIQS